MQYTKEMQLGKRRKPKQRDRTRIKKEDYQRMIEHWGAFCIVCGSPHIEAHHVRFRSRGGKGRWRNLLPLCQDHHRDAHTHDSTRKEYENKLEQEFGQHFWCDEFDLYDMGLIEHPTVREYEKYFEGVKK